jgi:FtsH-binding integral membrane protein
MSSRQVDRPASSRESGIAEQKAVHVAIMTIALPCAVSGLLWTLSYSQPAVPHLAAFVLMPTLGSMMAGSIIGWVAHRLFWRKTRLPLHYYVAIAMALVVDLTLFGWMQVYLSSLEECSR